MNWLSGVSNGGWDDDDGLDDLSDQSLEQQDDTSQQQQSENLNYEEEDNDNHEDVHDPVNTMDHWEQQQQLPPTNLSFQSPPPSNPSVAASDHGSSAMALGSGLFMGRLTRFIEAVTQPQEEEDEGDDDDDGNFDDEGNGWGDDDGLGDLEDDQEEEDAVDDNDDTFGNNDHVEALPERLVETTLMTPIRVGPPSTPTSTVQAVAASGGWDHDDDDLDLSDEPDGTGGDDGNDVGHTDMNKEEGEKEIRPVVDEPPMARTLFSTDDDTPAVVDQGQPQYHREDVLEEEEERSQTVPNSFPQYSSLSLTAFTVATEAAVADATFTSGWEIDDVLDGLDENNHHDEEIIFEREEADDRPVSVADPMVTSSLLPSALTTTTPSVSFSVLAPAAAPLSGISNDGWDEDIDPDFTETTDDKPQDGDHIIDQTPPPPPPPRTLADSESLAVSFAAQSTAAVAQSTTESGWEDDGIDDLDVPDVDDDLVPEDNLVENNKMVDMTPLPPLPRDSRTSESVMAVAVAAADGWDDDDDDLGNLDEEGLHPVDQDHTLLVDQTPPPPPPPDMNLKDTVTEAAIAEDDDFSRDDTLSIANSRARYEEQLLLNSQPPHVGPPVVDRLPEALGESVAFRRVETFDAVRSGFSIGSSIYDDGKAFVEGTIMTDEGNEQPIVDHTPSVASSRKDPNSSTIESTRALTGGNSGTTSVAESWDTSSDRMSESRARGRKMVDMTPSSARYHRGGQVDVSLGVAGHVSVGESLDSIDEEGEELDSPVPSIGDEYDVDIPLRDRPFFPFNYAGVTALTVGGGIPRTTAEHDEDESDDGRPLVDHTPLPLVKNQSTGASVEVLSVSSEEGDLGESIVGRDDVKDDLYGNVVDHTPATPNPLDRPRFQSRLPDFNRQEDDTVAGVAENIDVEKDIEADNDMDDESSRGTKTTLEEFENRSLVSTVRLTIPEEKQLVDHVPGDQQVVRTADASTVVFADVSEGSIRAEENDDDTAPTGFGPIVDHTPSVHIPSSRSIATSVVTQQSALDGELKEDDTTTYVVGGGASTGDEFEEGWGGEPSLPPSDTEEKHLVDHVPTRGLGRPGPYGGSMRVIVDNEDDTTEIDTIAEDAVTQFGPVVDHTPFSRHSIGESFGISIRAVAAKIQDEIDDSSVVGGSMAVAEIGWGNDIPELEDISVGDDGNDRAVVPQEPVVVDRIPGRSSISKPGDASIVVVVDPTEEELAVDDDSAVNHDTGSRFGPVVDHTPTPALSVTMPSVASSLRVLGVDVNGSRHRADEDLQDGGTWFGASTVGGVSTIGASVEASTDENSSGGGWEDDGDVLDDLTPPAPISRHAKEANRHVVDHVPDILSPGPTDASTGVLCDRSVASAHEKEELESNIDGGTYGAVVDHTPSLARPSSMSITTSVVTFVTGIATQDKRDEDMDETTWNGGESAKDNHDGWDHDEPELEGLGDDDRTSPVVDHVPERPESRPTDASTFVAGDPSEIFSQVDDLGQDETLFGPVVDQLPRASFGARASTFGSTIANIPSVAEDDLDVAVEMAIDGDDPRREAQEQVGWQETLPNPQSGNHEDDQNTEQLVDFVPVEEEVEVPDHVPDGSSEVATVGEKSNILPADDPKEDEFGPVVDHLPVPEISSDSSPVNALGGAYDRKPAAVPALDSVVPVFPAESKASKDDGLEEDEFGPVVDQLPSSSRASVTPSRGGSTVDALATVSEVEDDYADGEGWEDDVEIDAGYRTSPLAASRSTSDDRNLSVTWIDGLNGRSVPTGPNGRLSPGFVDARMGDTSRQPLNETRYYDPEVENINGWGSLRVDDSDGDETPPSTPRRPSATGEKTVLVASDVADEDDRLCTADHPCIKKLLVDNAGEEGIIGTLKTPEGRTIKVNFDKLLVNEMTKRRLVEKEFQALKSTIETLKATKDTLVLAGETQMEILRDLRSSNSTLQQKISSTKHESDVLRAQNVDFQSKTTTLLQQIAALEHEKQQLQDECLTMKSDTEVLQSKIMQISSSAAADLCAREKELKSELSKWKNSNEDLMHRMSQFETECENLRGKNESLYEDLESYRISLSKSEEEKATIIARESSLRVEVDQLRTSLQQQATDLAGTLQGQIKSLQHEVATKSGECAELESQISSIEKKLMASEAEKFKQTKELARVMQDKKQIVTELEHRLSTSREETESLRSEKDDKIDELKRNVAATSETIQQLRNEIATNEKQTRSVILLRQAAIDEKSQKIATLEQSLKVSSSKIDILEREKQDFANEMTSLRERSEAAEHEARDLLSVRSDNDKLTAELTIATSSISNLQEQLSQNQRLSQAADLAGTLQVEIANLRHEVATKSGECAELKSQISSIQTRLTASEAEKFKQTKELARVTQDKKQIVTELEHRLSTNKDEMESLRSVKDDEIDELKRNVAATSETIQQLRNESATKEEQTRSDMFLRQAAIDEKSQKIATLEQSLKVSSSKIDILEREKRGCMNEVMSLRERWEAAEHDSGDLLSVRADNDKLTFDLSSAALSISNLQEQLSQNQRLSQVALLQLQEQIDALRRERDQLIVDLSSARDRLDKESSSLVQVETENERLQHFIREQEQSRVLAEGEAVTSQAMSLELETMRSQLTDMIDQNKHLVGEKLEYSDRLAKAQQELDRKMLELEAALVERERTQAILRDSEKRAMDMKTKSDHAAAAQHRVESLLEELDNARVFASTQETKLSDLSEEHDSLRRELISSRQKCQAQDEEIRTLKVDLFEVEFYRDENASLLSQVQELQVSLDAADRARESLQTTGSEYGQQIEDISQRLESVSQERDKLLTERGMLEEENEEMLVQFGLLKEDMDATDAYVKELEEGQALLDQTAQNSALELQETKQRLEELTAHLEAVSNQSLLATELVQDNMTREKEKLLTSVRELTQRNMTMETSLKTVECEKQDLILRIAETQRLMSEVTNDTNAKESRMLAIIENLEIKNHELSNTSQFQEEQILELQSSLERSEENEREVDKVRYQVDALEESLSNSKELLQSKDSMIKELRNQLAISSSKPDDNAELELLRRTVREMEDSTERDRATIENLEIKNHELRNASHFHEEQISELQSSLARSEATGREVDQVRHQVGTLEESLSDAKQLLHRKDSMIKELRNQLASKPDESAELELLRRTVREMEESAERDRSHIQELEHFSDEMTCELRKAKNRVSASENGSSELRVELERTRQYEREVHELQQRLATAERHLHQANLDTLAFRTESTDLRGSLAALEAELEDQRRVSQQSTKEPSGQSSAELQALRQQIDMLKQQQIAASSQSGAREENIEREVHLLQQQMRKKDTEIGKLQSQLHSLGSDLSDKHKELESKQEHVEKLSSELKDLRSQSSTARTLDLTRDDAENSEKMREQIIFLAKALEKSEGHRAHVIERLEDERQVNADSLRRLTESVKRFYSTLSMGES